MFGSDLVLKFINKKHDFVLEDTTSTSYPIYKFYPTLIVFLL